MTSTGCASSSTRTELTDPSYTNLCLDTGHFAYYGGDNLRLIDKHPDRIGYLHLKQIDPELIWEVLKNDAAFADAAADIMVEPPRGIPELAPIIEAVASIDPALHPPPYRCEEPDRNQCRGGDTHRRRQRDQPRR